MYPWSTYYNNFTYGVWTTLSSYLFIAILVGLLATMAAGLWTFPSNRSPLGGITLGGTLLFASLLILSVLLGPGGVNVFGTRVRGIFFSEWKFFTFDLGIALPVAISNAAVGWWVARRKQNMDARSDAEKKHEPV
jgi:hypothetical protein